MAVAITRPVAVVSSTSNLTAYSFSSFLSTPGADPPSGWTETCDTGYTLPNAGGYVAYRAGGESGSTVTFGYGDPPVGAWGAIFAEVYEAGQPVLGGDNGGSSCFLTFSDF